MNDALQHLFLLGVVGVLGGRRMRFANGCKLID